MSLAPLIILKTAQLSDHNCGLKCTWHSGVFGIEGNCDVCRIDDIIDANGSIFDLPHIGRAHMLLSSLPPLRLMLEHDAVVRRIKM